MMPYDHFAAGYLFAFAMLKVLRPDLPVEQINLLLLWGGWWAVLVDWDMIVEFAMLGSMRMRNKVSHRRFMSHTPFFVLTIGLIMYFSAHSMYWQYFALTFLAAFASHMIVDSIEIGIMWLYPFKKKQFYLFEKDTDSDPYMKHNLFMFYVNMFRCVYMRMKTFYVGLVTVFVALLVFFLSH